MLLGDIERCRIDLWNRRPWYESGCNAMVGWLVSEERIRNTPYEVRTPETHNFDHDNTSNSIGTQ